MKKTIINILYIFLQTCLIASEAELAEDETTVEYGKNVFELAKTNKASLPFLDYLLTHVFKAHKPNFRRGCYSKEDYYQNLHGIHCAGTDLIVNAAEPVQSPIPKITHTILIKERETDEPLLNETQKGSFSKLIKALPVTSGWRHLLWVLDPGTILPQDLEGVAENTENIELMPIFSMNNSCINDLISAGKNDHAIAFLGYEILNTHGGITRTIDKPVNGNIALFCSTFSFLAELDNDTARVIDPSFLASTPHHPIINRALELARYHSDPDKARYCSYLQKLPNDPLAELHVKYGNGPISIAFHQHAVAERDMVLCYGGIPMLNRATRIGREIGGIENGALGGSYSIQLNLYKKYFMGNGDYTEAEILQDFLRQPSGVMESKRAEEVIFSLTSYPRRFELYTWLAIESLLRQIERPDRIVLNLFEGEFPGCELPWFIQHQIQRGLEINWCPVNFKVFLKVIPTMQKFPNAAVVAVDDDIIYPKERLRDLMVGYREHRDCIIAQEVREMTNLGGFIYPCCEWNFTGWNGFVDERKLGPSKLLVPEGVTGALFPPHSLHEIAYDFNQFKELTPTEDDLWLYSALVLNNRNVVKIPSVALPYVIQDAHSMDSALSLINTANGYKVSSQCFFNLFYGLNLKDSLSMLGFSQYGQECREKNRLSLAFGEFVTPRHVKSPVSLLDGFSWTEQWSGHKGGVWTNSTSASFSVVVPQTGFSKMKVKARFFKHASHKSIGFRIKRNGYTIVRGESESEWFDFTMVDCFESFLQKYDLLIDNPLAPSACGQSGDNRKLGILIHQVNVELLSALSFDRAYDRVRNSGTVAEICNIDPLMSLLREGAANISFDYALFHCGISELELKNKFSSIISNSHNTSIAREISSDPSIPFIHHRAWHTSPIIPCEVPENTLEKYIKSLKVMRTANEEWKHIFWCNGKELIPSTVSKLLSECPWLDVREVRDFPGVFIGKKFYELLMNDNRYTNANDVFRLSLIHEMGGIYLDLGFEVNQDISSWLQTHDTIIAMYSSGAIDHHILGMGPFNKFTESYLRRLQNPESISKVLISKWRREPYFQQHLFFGASGFLVDLLERANETDKILLIPENNPFVKRYSMNSWFAGNAFGNTPVERSGLDIFSL